MADIPVGELTGDTVFLSGNNAISVYNKGYYGFPEKDGVILSGFEALHLLELDRIVVIRDGISIQAEQLTFQFNTRIDDFMGRYLVYKDLRNRGYVVNQGSGSTFFFRLYLRGKIPKRDSASYYVTPLREGSSVNLTSLDTLVKMANSSQKSLVVGLVDASGDVSYLKINQLYPSSIVDTHNFLPIKNWDWIVAMEDYKTWEDVE